MVVLVWPPFMNKSDLDWFSRFFGYGGTYLGLERCFDALFRALTAIAHRECGFFEYGGIYSGRECDFPVFRMRGNTKGGFTVGRQSRENCRPI